MLRCDAGGPNTARLRRVAGHLIVTQLQVGAAAPVVSAPVAAPLRLCLDSTGYFDDTTELARRLQRDGYLLLRGVLPRSDVLAVRRAGLDVAASFGWLDLERPLDDARLTRRRQPLTRSRPTSTCSPVSIAPRICTPCSTIHE
jgi:hypothetical protein